MLETGFLSTLFWTVRGKVQISGRNLLTLAFTVAIIHMSQRWLGWQVLLPYTMSSFPGGTSKELACQCRRLKILVWSLGQENPLEKGMAIHSSILALRIPWTEEPGRPQLIGSQRSGHNWRDLVCTHAHTQICHVTTFLELKNVWTWLNPTTEYKHAAAETTHF